MCYIKEIALKLNILRQVYPEPMKRVDQGNGFQAQK